MARLSAKDRKGLSSSTFAGPNRSFPINDAGHARAALLDVGKAKGLTTAQKNAIKARARAKLKG